jgi:hypothetical protein
MKNKNPSTSSGQALIMLLFFIMVGITITTTAIFIIAGNSLAANNVQQEEITRQMAETGAEKAILQVLRNGNTYPGETLTNADVPNWDSGWNVVITVSGTTSLTIDSVARAGSYIKKVEVTAGYVDNELIINTWKEIN